MKRLNGFFFLISFLYCLTVNAQELIVMSFNTMCKSCDSHKHYGKFNDRLNYIADTIRRHNPDLISFQEFQFPNHVKKMEDRLGGEYNVYFRRHSLWPGTDEVLFVKKSRFETIEQGGMWLGPNAPYFSFGWKFRTPRRMQFARLKDRLTNKELLFVGSHFDSSTGNSFKSAEYANNFFKSYNIPVIFGGDTNLRDDFDGYHFLLGDNMIDTFHEVANINFVSNNQTTENEACSDGVSFNWPYCRIDHIFVSKNSGLKVESFSVDLFKYFQNEKHASDHRAIIVKFKMAQE
jgi:endonuclease/exonuclease/phosphatase family metal-dependent hydrolase